MKRAPRSRQRHDLYAKYHDYDSEISDLLGECGFRRPRQLIVVGQHPVPHVAAPFLLLISGQRQSSGRWERQSAATTLHPADPFPAISDNVPVSQTKILLLRRLRGFIRVRMSSLLRQLVTVFVVTIVSASFAISSAKAAMALECEITSARAVSDTFTNQLAALNQDNPGHDDIATDTESAAHQHQGHAEDNDASKDAHASHCKAHACPSMALPPFNNVMPATDVGQTLAVIQPESLVELTVPEGLRRPPRG